MNNYARLKDPGMENGEKKNFRKNARRNSGTIWKLALPVIGIVFLVCGSCLLRVYYKAKTESLTKQTARLERLIQIQKRELGCLRIREAEFTARSHVMKKLRNAGLRAPEYGQVTQIALIPPPGSFRKQDKSFAGTLPEYRKKKSVASSN